VITRLTEDVRETLLRGAAEEARRRGDQRVGTEHMLLGLPHDPASEASRALGVDLASARAGQDELDAAALRSVGIDAASVVPIAESAPARRLLPLTSGAREVLKRALETSRATETGRIGTQHFLLALLSRQRPDPAADLLFALDVDTAAVRDRLPA
jgi:ATP-dependent Clp protease ATP-binding subunit ClpA